MLRRELYLKRIELYVGRDVVKLITGVRRSGKTTLLNQLIAEMEESGIPQEAILYFNFDGLVHSYFSTAQALKELLGAYLQNRSGRTYIFLDELPPIAGWAKALAELRALFDCEFFVCASNTKLLYEGYAKELNYRYVRIEVYPFVFSEYLALMKERGEDSDRSQEELFADYLKRGAMPAVYQMEEEVSAPFLQDSYSAIILKDVVQCNKLRDISHIDKIMAFVLSHIGETFSPKSIRDYVRGQGVTISVDTVYSFLSALCASGLIYRVPRYDIKNSKQLETQEKYYICDLGLRNAAVGDAQLSEKAALENVLFMELLSRGFKVYVGKQGRYQIDFMAVKSENRTYLNCVPQLEGNEAIRHAFQPLMKIKDNYFKMVLSMDPETRVNKGGIVNYPLLQFLTQA